MGKRFGRNQKKAMRNTIASLNNQVNGLSFNNASLEAFNKIKTSTINDLINTVELTAKILGEHFISLPVKDKEVAELESFYRLHIQQRDSLFFRYADKAPLKHFVDCALERIDVFSADLEKNELTKNIHMRYHSHCGSVGYGISSHALHTLPDHILINMIKDDVAKRMATLLVEKIKENNKP